MAKRFPDKKTDALSQREESESNQNNQSNQEKEKKKEIEFTAEDPKYTLDDLVLPAHVKEQILDVVHYTQNSEIVFDRWGLGKTHHYSRRMGINFYGEPGTGKTMAAHAVAHYLNRKILIVNYADIESKYVGETPKNIRKAFEAAKEAQSIIFFDEADAILSRRVTNMSNATDTSVNQTRSVMLMLLNDYQDFIVFATNFIENFDPAFMRRISHHVRFDLPDLDCRRLLWRQYIPQEMPNTIDVDKLAKEFDGVSGSEISTAVLKAAFKAARAQATEVSQQDVEEAIEGILASKRANKKEYGKTTVETREVSEDYAKEQIAKQHQEQHPEEKPRKQEQETAKISREERGGNDSDLNKEYSDSNTPPKAEETSEQHVKQHQTENDE
ncbi:MAG: ATP-binding protein [Acetobacter sp.]|nr:ATP-binding protein [Acetobacter sp.]